jgi:D-alanine-D-alanine ligase
MNKIAVIAGGMSDERAVSIRSGAAVAEALRAANYDVVELDYSDNWDNSLATLSSCKVAFIALHGKGGEDGEIQAKLEAANIPYVGSGSASSALCFDKFRFSKLMIENGIPTPLTLLVDKNEYVHSDLIKKPYVLKPNDGGSSIDTFIVRDIGLDNQRQLDSFERHTKMILQPLISGAEITVAVIGDDTMPVIEIIPPIDMEFDYENKYNGATQELCPPKNISSENQLKAQNLALKVHDLCKCRDMSRTDMIVDEKGDLTVLEINTIPGFTAQSLLPKSAAIFGYSMPQLVDLLIKRALSRAN